MAIFSENSHPCSHFIYFPKRHSKSTAEDESDQQENVGLDSEWMCDVDEAKRMRQSSWCVLSSRRNEWVADGGGRESGNEGVPVVRRCMQGEACGGGWGGWAGRQAGRGADRGQTGGGTGWEAGRWVSPVQFRSCRWEVVHERGRWGVISGWKVVGMPGLIMRRFNKWCPRAITYISVPC